MGNLLSRFCVLSIKPTRAADKLPLEILLEIFAFAAMPPSPASPKYLSQVCQVWRAICHSQPSLWPRVRLDLADPVAGEKATHWLRMSGSVPLIVDVMRSSPCIVAHQERVRMVAALAMVLQPSLVRWRRFTFTSSANDGLVFFSRCHGPAPQLRFLSLSFDSKSTTAPGIRVPVRIATQPHTSLVLAISHPTHIISWPPAWTVTNLELTISHNIPNPQFIDFLYTIPFLERLSITASSMFPRILSFQNEPHSILLGRLQSLKMDNIISLSILEVIQVPALVVFSARGMEWNCENTDALAILLADPTCPLDEVVLAGKTCHSDVVVDTSLPIFELATLTKLRISGAPAAFLDLFFVPLATDIKLSRVSAPAATGLLFTSPSLAQLKLSTLIFPSEGFMPVFIYNHITTLTIKSNCLKALELCSLPGLRALSIKRKGSKTYPRIGRAMISLLTSGPTSSPLERVHLEGCSLFGDEFRLCLENMRFVRELTFERCRAAPEVWTTMANPQLLPGLNWLTVLDCLSASPLEILRVVRARNTAAAMTPNTIARLRGRVRFSDENIDINPDTLEELNLTGMFSDLAHSRVWSSNINGDHARSSQRILRGLAIGMVTTLALRWTPAWLVRVSEERRDDGSLA
ncbi:hypothetical protein BOTBODRAFT_629721 [Botryobasidium botryosum FD-172 SS1]|uniref:F-box domain-containing protein n=1 Tax=Botryobasidium botryosum (strain FD-172 SS1) TaxID=930990 RepID=A0A067MEJ6_BOTB1|nr:hypothetical protein BOTBODRAFT_629721 [Botryobasidium botryosum FD-172 SS1]